MRATVTPAPIRKGKRRLLETCAIAAGLMALAHGGPAMAQVAGSGTVTNLPSGTTAGTGANPSTVNVGGSQNIVTWTPSNAPVDGVVDFLPSGNTLNFVGNTPGYIVLNRFTSASGASITDQIALNGTVNSYVGSTTGPRGGNIWFQNAGGILIGSSGVINVGSLVLTANDIDTTGGLLGPGNTIRFRGAPGSTASVSVLGAINANNASDPGSSYVALVAPRVVQAGAVRVDGSAAYVAAEQADIRINSGLFDINVTVGAEGGTAITHTGSTTGPAHQQGDTDQSRIYMVAIPKNVAVTMLVAGQVGYDDAASAQLDPDGAVRLSAGYNVTGGELDAAPANGTAANITINDTLFGSDTVAHASGALTAQALQQLPASPGSPSQGQVFVDGNGTFIGDASATFDVGTGQFIGAAGDLTVQSGGAGGTPGSASVNVDGGQLGVDGDLIVDAEGARDPATGFSQGGIANLTVTNGGLAGIVGNVIVAANGVGGFDAGGNGGDGVGGTATITVSGAGSVLTGAIVGASATGLGGGVVLDPVNGAVVANNGGNGTGGTATVRVQTGGSLSAATGVLAVASGTGQTGLDQSGDGQGGTARIEVTGSGTSLQTPQTLVVASGTGGGTLISPSLEIFQSQIGGNGRGGSATLSVDADGTSTVSAGSVGLITSGFGGNAGGENSAGGEGQGGIASVTGAGGATVQFDDLGVLADGTGGGAISPSNETALSGDGIGGTVTVTATGGTTLAIDTNMVLLAGGVAPNTDNMGSANGGNVIVSATNNSNINVNGQLAVNAFAGVPGLPSFARSTGSSTGGNVDLTAADGGAIRAGNYVVNASAAVVNTSGTGEAAQGGTIDLTASSNGQILVTGSGGGQFFDASAATGVGGSSATGGTIQLIANGGVIDMGDGVQLVAGGLSGGALNPGPNNPEGRGGSILIQLVADTLNSSAINLGDFNASSEGRTAVNGETPFDTAGSGQGGTISFDVQGGTLTASGINASANGFGGGTGGGAGGGVGKGGTASFTQTGGTVNVGDMTISADGFGGIAPGQSGPGSGGTATIDLSGGTITTADMIATANGFGGEGSEGNDDDPANSTPGGLGGAGQGGTATITIGGSAVVDASIILANAAGTGGAGGEFFNASSFGGSPGTPGGGGGGTGGTATVSINGGTTTASSVIADASGIGGAGGGSFFSSSSGGATGVGVGGTGGTGQGGTATIALETAIAGVASASSVAQGVGGNGGDHNVGGAGGNGAGGLAQAIVTGFDAGQLAVTLDSSGLGGNGADGRDGAGGNGGGGGGGVSRIAATGAGASLTAVETNFVTGGTGGNGGNGQLGFGSFELTAPSGGNGGDGRGGTIEVAASEGATVTLGIVTGDAVVLGSTGTGGNGGNGSGSVFDTEAVAGDGGFGGAGAGGTVRLVANGGTITSNTESVEINAGGVSGAGGAGGIGNGGGSSGAAGGAFGTFGGRVAIEALNGLTGPGAITLGNTDINANGEVAGRIELRAEGNISFTGLDAEASGFADPTNNNTDVAPAGIFLALNGGTISSQGDASLTTGSSVGAYAQSDGIFDVDGLLTITATDQIDIRHDFREGTAPTIRASDSLTATAGGISGGPGSLLGSGDTLSLTSTLGAVGVDRLDAVNIIIDAAGAASVEHAEAVNDFTATGTSFRTGLNSIITGGDISVTSPGAIDLGNSTAGGSVFAEGQSVRFTAIDAGTTVSLRAQGFGPIDGVNGDSIVAGGDIALNGRGVTVDNIQTDGSLSASANFGPATLDSVNADGNISVFANGNVIGTFTAGGDIRLRSNADIFGAANAAGGYLDPTTGLAAEGLVFADANGNASLFGSSAATMLGVRAGGSVTLVTATAGEDVFVLAGTTANLAAVTAGDDLQVRADGGITVQSSRTTGAGPDGRSIVYQACCSNPSPFLQIQTSAADLSNVTLVAPTSTISATNVAAFDNFTATAGGVVTTGGLIRSGLATTISGSDLDLVAITAGTDVVLAANTGGISSTGALAAGHDVTVTAVGAVDVSEFDAGDDIRINTNGALTIGGAYSYGTGVDNEGDGSNIVLTAGGTNVGHAEADNDFIADVASFTTGLNSIITGGDIDITAAGAVDLGNSTAGGFVSVDGQSIAFNSITAGSTVGLNATGPSGPTPAISGGSIDAGGAINLSGNRIAITGPVTGDAGLFAFGSGGAVTINQADVAGDIAVVAAGNITGAYVSGGNITLNSNANITASAVANGGYVGPNGISEGYVLADADGNATLTDSSAATMLGVRAGQAASVSNATADEDVFVLAGTTATLANIAAGDDLTATAPGGITANGLLTAGAGPDNRTLVYAPSSSGAGALQITTAPADDSNIALTASAGNIGGGAMNAFDNLTLVAAGAITTTGTLRSGDATSIDGRSIVFNAINAGTTVNASAAGTAAGAEGIRGVGITAGDNINLDGNSIALTGTVNGGASLLATATGGGAAINQANLDGNIAVSAAGNLTGTYSAGGDVRLNSDANINASATAGGTSAQGDIFVDAGGNVVLANSIAARMFGVNAGGSATITGGAAGEDMLVRTGTTASLTDVTAGDDVDIRAGGNVTANNVRATGTGADTRFLNYLPASGFTIVQGEGSSAVDGSDITAASGGSINASALSAGDDILLDAATGIGLDGATTLGLGVTGGDSSIRTRGGATTLAGLDSFSDVIVDAAGLADLTGVVTAGRAATINAQDVRLATLTETGGNAIPTLNADGNIIVNSSAGIAGGGVRAGGDTTLTAGAAIAVTTVEGNSLALTGATGITADRVRSNGFDFTETVSLDSSDGDIRIGDLSASAPIDASANAIHIESGGPLRFETLTTDVGDAYVHGGNSVFSVANGSVAGTADFAATAEAMNIANLTAANAILVNSSGEMNLGTVTVAGRLDANTLTTIGVTGVVTGQSIGLSSANINIAPTGRVGTAGPTQSVSITNNNSANQTFVGGTGTRDGYHIDADELTRVFGTDIEIFAPQVQIVGGLSVGSATPPDVVVDSFTMAGGASGSNLGANGALTIRTPGKMRVIGNVQLTGLTDNNMLSLRADQALEVILGQGSVRLANGTNPAGQLRIMSGDIIVATQAAIADVGAATTIDAIETRLAQNDGILLDEGALFAGGIRATGNFYVQNSGSGTKYAERRGLTFGAGGLDVVTEGPVRTVINGVQIGPNGQITGLDVIPLLTIGGSTAATGNIDPRSTLNGCVIANPSACVVVTFENNFPVQDVIEEEADADSDDGDGNNLPTPLITMRDLDPLSGEPLLDDPVTGAGNDDLWTPTLDTCDPASAPGGSCPAAE